MTFWPNAKCDIPGNILIHTCQTFFCAKGWVLKGHGISWKSHGKIMEFKGSEGAWTLVISSPGHQNLRYLVLSSQRRYVGLWEAQDDKMFISREASPIFPNLNCVFMYKKAKFPPKFQNFPPHIYISREWASQIPHFFSPWWEVCAHVIHKFLEYAVEWSVDFGLRQSSCSLNNFKLAVESSYILLDAVSKLACWSNAAEHINACMHVPARTHNNHKIAVHS